MRRLADRLNQRERQVEEQKLTILDLQNENIVLKVNGPSQRTVSMSQLEDVTSHRQYIALQNQLAVVAANVKNFEKSNENLHNELILSKQNFEYGQQ